MLLAYLSDGIFAWLIVSLIGVILFASYVSYRRKSYRRIKRLNQLERLQNL